MTAVISTGRQAQARARHAGFNERHAVAYELAQIGDEDHAVEERDPEECDEA